MDMLKILLLGPEGGRDEANIKDIYGLYKLVVREQPRGVATTRLKRPSLPAATCGPLESCLYRHVYTGAGGISPLRPPLGVVTYDNM
ncbi:hypothetical protein M747DRAFT_314201 [Aspergillus niger ATCC 13496]|uniref:Uncharacterized protein n=1 Tax=Aspergillus niger ATCC 13496 TaxID=1353008 RepID=A0A370C0N2_ASPNG|nr:hypothetical protein M747DRAFT_314201 [Aspergillus niger ATCC 13496]